MLNTPFPTLLDNQFEHLLLYTLTFCLPSQAEVAGLISDECGGHNNPFVACHQKATHTIVCPVFPKRGLILSCNETGVKNNGSAIGHCYTMRKCALIILSVPVPRTGARLTAARYFVKQMSLVCHVSVSGRQTTRHIWWTGLLCTSARLRGQGIGFIASAIALSQIAVQVACCQLTI